MTGVRESVVAGMRGRAAWRAREGEVGVRGEGFVQKRVGFGQEGSEGVAGGKRDQGKC